jgi:hypothetical protein
MAKKSKEKEFETSAYVSPGGPDSKEPAMAEMGYSVLNYGEQRFGVGDEGEEPETYAEPGEEGRIAVDILLASGAFGSHEKFEGPMQGTPTGA